jgi:hypothetical protein
MWKHLGRHINKAQLSINKAQLVSKKISPFYREHIDQIDPISWRHDRSSQRRRVRGPRMVLWCKEYEREAARRQGGLESPSRGAQDRHGADQDSTSQNRRGEFSFFARFFLYLFYGDSAKIYGVPKILQKYAYAAVAPRRQGHNAVGCGARCRQEWARTLNAQATMFTPWRRGPRRHGPNVGCQRGAELTSAHCFLPLWAAAVGIFFYF